VFLLRENISFDDVRAAREPTPDGPGGPMTLSGKTILLGVTGGIAAYKTPDLVRVLTRAGAQVRVILTRAAEEFVTPLTLQTVSGRPVARSLFDLTEESEIGHIQLADSADAW
jgi:phosphopantothenoylcysteine decarboxylase/phosphopantothenate--cysteine ligase